MEQVNNIELIDPEIYPDNAVLEPLLGKGFAPYIELVDMAKGMGMEAEWKYYKDGKAWLCKVQYRKRTIVWMSAWKNYIKATVYFADRFVEELMASELPIGVKSSLKEIKKVGKSIPLSFEIRNSKAIEYLRIAIDLKMALR